MTTKRMLAYLATAAALLLCLGYYASPQSHPRPVPPTGYASTPIHQVTVADNILKGEVIAGKLENATAKAELGRAAWKFLHTTMARFPDRPTEDEQTALTSFVHLFARLYPCGECAGHFRQILQKFPPQVSTRSAAAVWACHVHNEVNKSLSKALFDCSKIGDFYDCGCADTTEVAATTTPPPPTSSARIDLRIESPGETAGG